MKIIDLATFRASGKILPPGRKSRLSPGQTVRRNGLTGEILSFERTFREFDLFKIAWDNGTTTTCAHDNLVVVEDGRKASA